MGPCTLVGIPLRLSSAVPWGSQPDRTPGAHSGDWLEQHLQLAPFSSGLTFQLRNHCFLGLPASNHLHWNCCLRACFWGTPHKTLLIFKIFSMTVDIQCYSALVAGVQHSDGTITYFVSVPPSKYPPGTIHSCYNIIGCIPYAVICISVTIL